MSMSKRSKMIIYTLLTLMALYFLPSFAYMLFTTLKTGTEATAYSPRLFSVKWLWENYISAWRAQPFGQRFLNSALMTVGTTAGQIISCSPAAYGFAKCNFKGKNIIFMILLSIMMIPWDVTMILQCMEFKIFDRINTLKPLIMPSWFDSAYYISLMRQFLIGMSKDFEETARTNGASAFQTYWRIFMPTMKPQLILIGVLNMITVWNDYLGPPIFLQGRSKFTLTLGLASFRGAHSTQIIPMLCITVIMIPPPIIVFLFAQKHIVKGTSGVTKQPEGDDDGKA